MKASTFLKDILCPTLLKMEMHSPAAERLLLMTACHESGGFKYDRQEGGGPALSYYQIEPDTLKDLYRNYLRFRPDMQAVLDRFKPTADCTPEQALMDPVYATAAARMIYRRVPQRLPALDDYMGMARYWKTFYNTPLGKGTEGKFLADAIKHLCQWSV